MKQLLLILVLILNGNHMETTTKNLHDFTVKANDGSDFNLAQFKGKKVLVVNVASECGYTPQYETLQEVYEEFGPEKFTIIAFPSNDFGGQEPGTNEEIMSFCKKNYGVTFPVMSKITVVGNEMHPLYQWLTKKELNGVADAPVKWNFQKFLIDEEGNWVSMVPTKESPASEEIINWITNQ